VNLMAGFVYSFILNYLLFSLYGHSFLAKLRLHIGLMLVKTLLFVALSTLMLLLVILLSRQLQYSWRVLLFFIQFSGSTLIFFFLYHNVVIFKRYDMPEDFIIYPYAIVLMSSTLFILDAERTLHWYEGLFSYASTIIGVWLAAYIAFMFEEKFILDGHVAREGSKVYLFLSAAIMYMIFSPLI
jgi:hypothetical protein